MFHTCDHTCAHTGLSCRFCGAEISHVGVCPSCKRSVGEMMFDLIGKPFKDGGRGPMAYDCWGLIMEAGKRIGVSIPEKPDYSGFEEVDQPSVGDVVLLRIEGVPTHVGMIIKPGMFIHVIRDQSVVAERLTGLRWSNRIVGFYRRTGQNGLKQDNPVRREANLDPSHRPHS